MLQIPLASNDHIQGNVNASITLVKYGDYQCPSCAKAYFVVKELQKHYGDRLKFVFRNFPLKEAHLFAEPAAETAEFAADHGLFWEMHDQIYENQAYLDIPLLFDLTGSLGLPVEKIGLVIEKKAYEQKIHGDFIGGVRSGVNGTPTFFINDQRYNGSFEFADLAKAIDAVLH